jgi:hypothetical protein
VVSLAYDPSHLRFKISLGKVLMRPNFEEQNMLGGYTVVTPAIWEAELGGSRTYTLLPPSESMKLQNY